MAKIYPLHMFQDPQVQRELGELKQAFVEEHMSFFILALDTSQKLGAPSPKSVKVFRRAFELLQEAKGKFEKEFN